MRESDQYHYRELNRIALELKGSEFEHNREISDRLELLNSGFIFYPRRFVAALWYGLRSAVMLRCPVCRRRHLFNSYHIESPGISFHCGYGWWWGVKDILVGAWAYGQNGDD